MTTTLRNVMLVNLLAGCQLGNTLGDPLDQTGGGDGTPGLGMPDGCVEDHREVVADPAVAPEGFEESALDVIEGLTGSFGADVAMEDGSVLPVALSVAWDGGEVQAVYRRWSTNDQVEGPPMGAPATEDSGIEDEDACGPVYAFGVTTSLSALPLVGADGAGEVMFPCRATSARSRRRASVTRCAGREPSSTMATGVEGSRPCSTRRAPIASSSATPM